MPFGPTFAFGFGGEETSQLEGTIRRNRRIVGVTTMKAVARVAHVMRKPNELKSRDGVGLRIIQLALRHASVQQTQRRVNVTDDEELRRGLEVCWKRSRRWSARAAFALRASAGQAFAWLANPPSRFALRRDRPA
jgi:hypothetical protein